MTSSPVAKKLGIKVGMSALILGAPPGYVKSLAPLPEGVVLSDKIGDTHQFVQFSSTRKAEIQKTV